MLRVIFPPFPNFLLQICMPDIYANISFYFVVCCWNSISLQNQASNSSKGNQNHFPSGSFIFLAWGGVVMVVEELCLPPLDSEMKLLHITIIWADEIKSFDFPICALYYTFHDIVSVSWFLMN